MGAIINTVLSGGAGDTVNASAIGVAKDIDVGDKVLLNTSLSQGPYFNPDRTPGGTLSYCAWADMVSNKAYWIINGNSSSSANKDGVIYDISDTDHVTYLGTFILPSVPQTSYADIVVGSSYLGCFGYADGTNLYLMIKNNEGIMDGTLSQSFTCPQYFSLSNNSNILCYYDGSVSHVVRLTKNSSGLYDVQELTLTTTPTRPDVGTVSQDGTLIYYRRQIYRVNETTVDLINSNSVGPSTSYSVDLGGFTPDNKYLFVSQRGTCYTFELGEDGSLPSVVLSQISFGNTIASHVYLCNNGYMQRSNGLCAYNQGTGVVTSIWNSGNSSTRSSFTPLNEGWTVGVDAPTGGLFSVNGVNSPTQLPFSPLDTQVTSISSFSDNIIAADSIAQLNTTGLSVLYNYPLPNSSTTYQYEVSLNNGSLFGNRYYFDAVNNVIGTGTTTSNILGVNQVMGFVGDYTYNGRTYLYCDSSGVISTFSVTSGGTSASYTCIPVFINNKVYTVKVGTSANFYEGTIDYENKTITFTSSSDPGTSALGTDKQVVVVSKDQTYVFACTSSGTNLQILKYDSSTETFSLIDTPSVITSNITGAIINMQVSGNNFVICSGQSIYTFAWTDGDISTIALVDTFTNPIPVSLIPLGSSSQFYVFNRAVFSKGESTSQVAEVFNGHNFNNTTLTGFVKKVNDDGTLEVSTVLG